MTKLFGVLCVSVTALSTAALADEFKPAVVYDVAGIADKSFNQSVYEATKKFTKETGIKVHNQETTNQSQFEQFHHDLAAKGFNPIIGVGFAEADAVKKASTEFPKTKFAIIDMVVDTPNTESIVFKEQEGSFLVGILAALKSKTGTVGFVGGMDIPLIRRFECGYALGAKFANPNIKVLMNMTGTTPAAWSDPVKGGELAKSQMEQGADVIYAAAGGTGTGVLQAAADAGKFAIGVDSDQNYLQPGHILTSMVKHVDLAALKVFNDAKNGTWKPGISVLGVAQGGVEPAFDQYNEKLVTPAMRAKVKEAKEAIVSGKIQVHDYMADNACPA